MTVDELENRVLEIKKIWLEHLNEPLKQLSQEELKGFGIEVTVPGTRLRTPEFFWLVRKVKNWRKEIFGKEIKKKAASMTDEDVDEQLRTNRKESILILSQVLANYKKHPDRLRDVNIGKISHLYNIISQSEEAAKRTEIAYHKEKRETIQMIIPYQRLTEEQRKLLTEKANAELSQLSQS